MKTYLIYTLIFAMISFCGCNYFNHNEIPAEFRNHSVISASAYTKDSSAIVEGLKVLLNAHAGFFYSKEYFSGTELIIDTIIYDTEYKKMAVFLITKNPTSRQLSPQAGKWYFNANCYAGIRKNGIIELHSIGPSFRGSASEKKMSEIIRREYFTWYSKQKDRTGNLRYKYNIGDTRFWTCPIWNEIN